MKRLRYSILVCVMIAMVFGTALVVEASAPRFSRTEITLKKKKKKKLKLVRLSKKQKKKKWKFTSSDKAIAKVKRSGKSSCVITAKKKNGFAIIQAQQGSTKVYTVVKVGTGSTTQNRTTRIWANHIGYSLPSENSGVENTFSVGDNHYVTNITISGPSTVAAGNSITLKANISPSDATNTTVTWISSNTGIASINSQGVVTGVSPGNAIIVAKANDGSGKTAGAVIVVTEKTTPTPVTPTYTYSLSVGTVPKKVAVNESVTVTCTISSDDSNAKLEASTKAGSCLSVEASGRTVVLTGKIQCNAVPFVITYGDKSYSFTIDVYDKETKEYIEEQWRKKMISQMGLASMPPLQRFTTITQHIAMNYPYRYTPEGKTFTFSNDLVNRYPNDYILGGDCITSATEIYHYSLLMGYDDNTVQAYHPYSNSNHTLTKILINNQWIAFDAGYSDTWTQESGRSWSVHNLSTGNSFGYIPNNPSGNYYVVTGNSTKNYDHLVYPDW